MLLYDLSLDFSPKQNWNQIKRRFESKLLLCDLSLDLPPLCHSCQQMRVKDPTRQTRAKRHEMNTTALLHFCYLPLVMLPFHKSPSLSISKLSILQNPVTIFSEEFTDLVSQRIWVYESCIFSRYLGFHSSWPDITVFSWTCFCWTHSELQKANE